MKIVIIFILCIICIVCGSCTSKQDTSSLQEKNSKEYDTTFNPWYHISYRTDDSGCYSNIAMLMLRKFGLLLLQSA